MYCRLSYNRYPITPYQGVRLISLPSLQKAGLQMLSHTPLATLHAIFNNTADIISYHGMGNALFLPLCRLGRKRSVVYMDGIDWERPKWGRIARILLKYAAAAAFRWADAVYVDNLVSQQEFAQIFGKTPQVITLAAEKWPHPGDDMLRQFGIAPGGYNLFVGMLHPDKGVHLLLEAYAKLDVDIPLVIVGDNPDDPTYVRSLKDNCDHRVKFLGYQYGLAARQLFANCLIYIQPSIMEGNSPALMSAMACGRCVVVNGILQNRETIGDAGVAFEQGNVTDLRNKLQDLLADRGRITTLGLHAQKRIDTVYNWEKVIDELEEVYTRLAMS